MSGITLIMYIEPLNMTKECIAPHMLYDSHLGLLVHSVPSAADKLNFKLIYHMDLIKAKEAGDSY